MLFIRKDKNLSGQRKLTKSSIQSIRTEKGVKSAKRQHLSDAFVDSFKSTE